MTYRGIKDDYIIAGHVARLEDEYKADAVFIDLGYGTGIYSGGQQMGRKWILVPFGGKAKDQGLLNKRVEIWRDMKLWMMGGGALENDSIICDELIAPESYVVATGQNAGKIFLESKEDLKKRGIASPNRADALALTFSAPVLNKSQKQFISLNTRQQDYNPLALNQIQNTEEYNPLSPLSKVTHD